jgi:uncharacterized protein YkwD
MKMKGAVVGAVVVAVLGLSVTPATAQSMRVACLERINEIRAQHDRKPLSLHKPLAKYAKAHSADMAADGELWHSNLPGVLKKYDWSYAGENIAYGDNVKQIHQMFMASPSHRKNILRKSFKYVGCNAVHSDGWLWLTEVFYE